MLNREMPILLKKTLIGDQPLGCCCLLNFTEAIRLIT